jgi:hypothetical protein
MSAAKKTNVRAKAVEREWPMHYFDVLVGAARVLGETFEMNIAEVLESGGFKLDRARIPPQKRGSAAAD